MAARILTFPLQGKFSIEKFTSNFQSFTVCADTDGTVQRQQDFTHSARHSDRWWLRIQPPCEGNKASGKQRSWLPWCCEKVDWRQKHAWWRRCNKGSSLHLPITRHVPKSPYPVWRDDVTAHVPCFSLSLLSSPVAKQWLFLQNWNPIPAASVVAYLSAQHLKKDRHEIPPEGRLQITRRCSDRTEEGAMDRGLTGGAGVLLWDLLQCQSGSHHRQKMVSLQKIRFGWDVTL